MKQQNELIKTYRTLRAARCAAAQYRKQDNIVRCNVFLKIVFLKSGLAKRNKRGAVISLPAVYIQRQTA